MIDQFCHNQQSTTNGTGKKREDASLVDVFVLFHLNYWKVPEVDDIFKMTLKIMNNRPVEPVKVEQTESDRVSGFNSSQFASLFIVYKFLLCIFAFQSRVCKVMRDNGDNYY